MKPIKDNLDLIIRRALSKQHPLLPDIMINWSKIVDSKISTRTHPLKVTTGIHKGQKINILHIQTENSSIALKISFQQEIILERIAIYLGFKAIHTLRIMVYNSSK
ncbi:DciA family protein [Rickettsia endosymbiont of Halotydeus destructor]|uniref:DciA family protein n=1 Tax=Rickettsia endosymbiont of Halotydeus destructor TaxID=2996754 RepID=UPI003BAE2DE9